MDMDMDMDMDIDIDIYIYIYIVYRKFNSYTKIPFYFAYFCGSF